MFRLVIFIFVLLIAFSSAKIIFVVNYLHNILSNILSNFSYSQSNGFICNYNTLIRPVEQPTIEVIVFRTSVSTFGKL